MTTEDMDEFTIKRWATLIMGVNLIYDTATKCGVPDDEVTLKQNYLVKYIWVIKG